MSELITLEFYTTTCVPLLFALGKALGKAVSKDAVQRHLLRHATQITDRKILRQALELLGLKVQEGDPQQQRRRRPGQQASSRRPRAGVSSQCQSPFVHHISRRFYHCVHCDPSPSPSLLAFG